MCWRKLNGQGRREIFHYSPFQTFKFSQVNVFWDPSNKTER